MSLFDYDPAEELHLSPRAVSSHVEAVRFINHSLPATFYDRTERQLSLTSWMPFPGSSVEMVPDDEFVFYCTAQDAERVPTITSYHGHTMLMPVVRIKYLGRSRKFLRCAVTFVRRYWDAEQNVAVTEEWLTVPAVQGDNNHIRLLEGLPSETDLNLDQTLFFTETPDEMDDDFHVRMERAYGAVLEELL